MSTDFWSFWRSGYGFDKSAWMVEYLRDRQDRPLKPGKTRRPSVSNTRRVIEWILEEANPVRCLETNIYAAPTEQAADLASTSRVTAPFDFLVGAIRPEVMIVHGREAAEYLQGREIAARFVRVPHFSRGWSQSGARALGQQIRRDYAGSAK